MLRPRVAMLAALAVFVTAPALAAEAPATLPDTPAGRRTAALLQVFNEGDGRKMLAFVQENYAKAALAQRPAKQHLGIYGELWVDTEGLTLQKVESSKARTLILVARDKLAGDTVRLQVDVEAKAPHGITGVKVQPITPGDSGRPLTHEEVASATRAYVEKLTAAEAFSGTVLIAQGDKVIYQGAFGLASRGFQVPNRLDTKFNLGSLNKMFTAVAIAQLAEAGKLSFQDKVGKLLPDYPNKAVAEQVTVHQLLTHTSGLGSFFNDKYEAADKSRLREVKDFLPLFVDEPLKFEPGTRWRYSNSGFVLLGAIIEKVSGRSYFEYVREHIYKPAGMTNSDCYEIDRDPPNLAVGYTNQGPGGKESPKRDWNNLYLHVVKGGPAGGGYSTVEDLWRFSQALQANKLLGDKATQLVTTGKVQPDPEDPANRYAYGFNEERAQGTRIIGHGGGFPGINSQLDIYLDKGYTVAVMSNQDPPSAGRVVQRIRKLLGVTP
ncbi:beta-lactamase family protein [Pyxidicoccus fallax]|uniref:Beta-lactamase family protein n=1 Tax=Pyxidicoccus fallax TaxID=394095 RepID=A0A848LM56_9BACT|nr:serine hydrolase domain-containing protein [Pyxidicoccus fallax]NMO18826.1 beta-lactamase family protein [Pyxidicoccus fallax]NPC78031.1 beta-lactamase family protein [Pyxidicoccus fallax]